MENTMEKKAGTKREPRTCNRTELALRYNPNLTASAARKRLAAWIARHPTLVSELRMAGFDERQRTYTPRQVAIIMEALGEP